MRFADTRAAARPRLRHRHGHRRRIRALAVLAALACAPGLAAGCRASGPRSAADVGVGQVDPAARSQLPPEILARGLVTIATDPTYPPDEFRQSDGTLVGMDVDLARAVGAKLGVRVQFTQVQFRDILAGVQQGEYDIGVSSITDTTRREELGDFVTYFQAGSSLLVRGGNPLTLYPDDESLCGHRVAAQEGTVEVDPVLSSRSAQCVADGLRPITTVVVAAEADSRAAVLSGRADAMFEDAPIASYETAHSGGQLQTAGDQIDKAPYGFALAKEDKPMDDAILRAMQDLIDDGEYAAILSHWGLTAGRVPAATLDGAIN
ncbi:polar amino acid transport system substrate-binding protein [Catenulispora sp. MAP5-51]|uniref:ABC transporter substrate-binding protein n=1 Tax=Catenulispora sp. MAP5-51 TaxID=3156298 RepID=UPI0035170196